MDCSDCEGGNTKTAKVIRGGEVLFEHCAVTESAWERMLGLLPRDRLAPEEALWIAPGMAIHTFFMRFPIDAAFLDSEGKVVAVYENLVPWRHSWFHPRASGVLETAAGRLHGVRTGEVLEICHTS